MVDCYSAPNLLPFEQALSNILSQVPSVIETEEVLISEALNRVLANVTKSPLNVPPHDNSAMDGYAFAKESFTDQNSANTLTLIGRSMAGEPFQGECLAGQCVRIMTGAKLPKGCDTVEMQENCEVVNNQADGLSHITFLEPKEQGDNVRYAGEDIKENQVVFEQGRKLSAIDVGVLASLGVPTVTVYRKLTVALISTGDELKLPGESLTEGDIFESNSFTLAAMLEKLNINVLKLGVIKDDKQAITDAFIKADKEADAIFSSGGVSVGEADYTKEVLDELGDISFWKIAMKPGKPFAFGKLPNSVFFGLPGNPVSATVTAHMLAVPALAKMQNCINAAPVKLRVKTATNIRKSPGRMDFQRGILSTNEQSEMFVSSTGNQGSGVLTSLAKANCYIVLPAEQGSVEANEIVTVQLFDSVIQH
jgi:molybdopterin molybdotransferase